jgi:hypothetical protein
MLDTQLTPIQDFTNDIVSTSLARSLIYPLEVAQTVVQTEGEDAKDGVISTLFNIFEKRGFWSLFRGNIASCSIGTTLAIGSFLGASPAFRDLTSTNTPLSKFLVGSALTTLVYPLQVAKIRMIASPTKYKSTLETLNQIYKEEELPALYRGLPSTLISFAVNTAALAVSYRVIAAIWNKQRRELSGWYVFLFDTLATILASLALHPLDTAIKLVQSRARDTDNVLRTLLNTGKIPRPAGFQGLYQGFFANFFKPFAIPLQAHIAEFTRTVIFGAKRHY